MFRVSSDFIDDDAVLRVEGNLTIKNARQLKAELQRYNTSDFKKVCLADIENIDLSAIQILIAYKIERNKEFVSGAKLTPQQKELLEKTGLLGLLLS